MRWMLIAMLIGCGGTAAAPSVAGCWNYALDDVPSGRLDLTLTETTVSGAFTEPTRSGLVHGTIEPNGNIALLLYTPERLIWDVTIHAFTDPLTGFVTDHSNSTGRAFIATRC